jgi:hypothetical protein
MSGELTECSGFILFNDPHLSSRRPGTRKDRAYGDVIIGKLAQIIDIANRGRLVPLCTGDWFQRAKEEDERIKTQLLRVLNGCWTRQGISCVGNHDCRNLKLADGDTLAVIAESGAMRIARQNGPAGEFLVRGTERDWRVGVGCTPSGQEIPREVGSLFPLADGIIWLTHHDIAFDGAYPGAVEPFEISGCSLVWNGHMHLEKQPVTLGRTMWCNAGSITRTAIDAIDHQPAAWEFSPETGLVRHLIECGSDVFDLTGSLVGAISPGEPDGGGGSDSVFVDLLRQDTEADPAATDEGTVLLQHIRSRFDRENTPEQVRAAVLRLFNDEVDAAGALAAS